jgi:hypothetical protein
LSEGLGSVSTIGNHKFAEPIHFFAVRCQLAGEKQQKTESLTQLASYNDFEGLFTQAEKDSNKN